MDEPSVLPLQVKLETAARLQSFHGAIGPRRWQGRQQEHETVVALQQHLGNACRTAEVAVYLEWRMGIKQIRIGASTLFLRAEDEEGVGRERQLVLNELVGMVAVEETGPRTHLPAHRPSGGDVAASRQRGAGGTEQLGRAIGRNLTRRIQSEEVGKVSVVVLRVIYVVEPLLQLSPTSYLHGRQTAQLLGNRGEQRVVVVKDACRREHFVVEFEENLVVHGDTGVERRRSALAAMFGRFAGTHHEIGLAIGRGQMAGIRSGQLGKGLRVEARCLQHDGIGTAQEGLVASVEIVFPQMAAYPARPRAPQSARCVVDGPRHAPLVGVVMEHPSVGAIHTGCRLAPCLADFPDEPEKGFVHLRQVGHLRRPVVHLEVDVGGVFRIPRGQHLLVPDALQIGGIEVIGLRRADEQIAPKLEVGGYEMAVVVRAETVYALVGGHLWEEVFAQVERHAVVVAVIDLLMACLQLSVAPCHGLVKPLPTLLLLVAADVVVGLHIGADGYVERGLVGARHGQLSVVLRHAAAHRLRGHAAFEAHFPLQVLVLG